MKEINIKILNPRRMSEQYPKNNDRNYLELTINGKRVYGVKRFAIDIDTTKNLEHEDITYILEKYLNVQEMYYDDTDSIKSTEDWLKVSNDISWEEAVGKVKNEVTCDGINTVKEPEH